MDTPLISIIIPVYNREVTLHYCIDSVLSQDYHNWELLLIDDGSTDNSSEICLSYSEKDKRIKYYHQNNMGAGPARNNGIQHAIGQWITFVDSDDAILPNHLSQFFQHANGHDLVMVNHCQAHYVENNLVKTSDYWNNVKDIHISGNKEIVKFLFSVLNPYEKYIYCCWDKFFRADVIRKYGIQYPEDVPTGQDMMFVVDFFKHTQSFYFSCYGTYAQTPMGNNGINHLALQLRMPEAYFHCHMRNYNNLRFLYDLSGIEDVRKYAVHYVLTDSFVRSVLRFTNCRNRRFCSKKQLLHFMNGPFRSLIKEVTDELDYVRNPLYRNQLKMIVNNKSENVYNYWFYRNLRNGISKKLKQLLK